MARQIRDLPYALGEREALARRFVGKQPAVFLDYDGTLTPIRDRPEDAVISASMREAVRKLNERVPVAVVSGRDRQVVQELMGLDNLIVAGDHGFDIWSPTGGSIQREEGASFEGFLREVEARLRAALADVPGALVEPKKRSVAAHFRLVPEEQRPRGKQIVDAILSEHPEELKVTPGKMVCEIQRRLDWDKGKAVLYLLKALDLDRDDVVPVYLGDDFTDEDAFRALAGRGIGIFVGSADDPETAGRTTAADYVLNTMGEVEQFLNRLAALDSAQGKLTPPGGGSKPNPKNWTLAYDAFEPEQERLREVLTSTGNGYFCTRGAAEWADVDETHYPGTYAHGCYNRETTILGGQPVPNEDLVNLPNWLVLKLRIEGGEPIGLGNVELLSYRHELDVRNATMLRTLRLRDRMGRETALASRRSVSMADRQPGAIEWTT